MNAPSSKFLLLPTLFCIAFAMPQPSSAQKLSEEPFKTAMEKALAERDSAKISGLIAANRYQVVAYANQLLTAYIANELAGNRRASASKLAEARTLAKRYKEIHANSVLLDHAALFQRWPKEQKTLKAKADSLNQAGVQFAQQTKYLPAIAEMRKALAIFQPLEDKYSTGIVFLNIGKAYRHANQYQAAMDTLKLALAFVRETENKKSEGNVLRELGVVAYLTGDPPTALRYWEMAANAFEEINEQDGLATTLNHIGIYYKNIGLPKEAESYYRRSLKVHQEVDNEREAGNDLNNLGNIYMDFWADYGAAIRYFEQALAIKEKHNETALAGVILGNLGICAKKQGDYQSALRHFHAAVNIGRDLQQPSLIAKNLSDIGSVYTDIGKFDIAAEYYDQALETFREIDERRWQVETLINQGANYGRMNQPDTALARYQEALNIADKLALPGSKSTILGNMAEVELELKNDIKAAQLYFESLKIAKEIKDQRQQAISERWIGEYFFKQSNYTRALASYKNSLEISLEIGAPEEIWRAYSGVGKVLQKQGKRSEAMRHYQMAVETIESIRSRLSLESLKQSFLEEKMEVYHAMVRLLHELGRDEEAFEFVERAKARGLLDILAAKRFNITEGIPPELLQRKKESEFRLRRANELLAKAHGANASTSQIATLEDSLSRVRFAYEELLQEIKLNHPRYAQLTGAAAPLALREIQKRIIPPGSALIEYMVSEAQTLAFVVGPDTLVSLALDLGETELRAMVDALLEDARIVGAGKIRNFAEIRFDLATAHRLYNKLVAPLERHIPIGNALIIIPDGVLHYLPFEALVAGIREGPLLPPAPLPWYKRLFAKSTMRHAPLFQEYESAYFLAEKFAISYASSASVLDSEILLSQKRHVPSENLAIFASPDFSRASQTQLASLRAAPIFNFASLILMGPDNVWEFSPLLQTENYARQMARQVRPSNLFVGAAATEESFKREAGNYRYVHIATHTATEERMPMYSRIIFAQDDDPAEDGFLHTHEILNLRLSAELVTLVGCRTGLGRLQRGEGLVGLTRAFIYAGAPSVVVSLWAVEESSGLLMKYFYANLEQGMSKAEALRQAKLRMIKSRGKLPDGKEISYAHPFLWAPFVLVGENR